MKYFSQKFDRRLKESGLSHEQLDDRFPQLAEITRLSGGFSNANYRVQTGARAAVLRIARDPAALAVEVAALSRVRGQVPAPEVLDTGEDGERSWALLSWVDGAPMDRVLEAGVSREEAAQLGAACGRVLAAIHRVTFERPGFFDSALQVVEPLEPVGRGYLDHVRGTLAKSIPRARLGEALALQVEALLDRRGGTLDALERDRCLVHSDFNTKNLLVQRVDGRWTVSGVLDWEFAHAGPALADVANFLRFEEEAPPPLAARFREGYARAGGLLGDASIEQMLLLDLASMASFLDGPDRRPKTVATARGVITRTVAQLG